MQMKEWKISGLLWFRLMRKMKVKIILCHSLDTSGNREDKDSSISGIRAEKSGVRRKNAFPRGQDRACEAGKGSLWSLYSRYAVMQSSYRKEGEGS